MNKIGIGIGIGAVLMFVTTACSSGGHSSSARHSLTVAPAIAGPSTTPAAVLQRIKECGNHSCPAHVPAHTVDVFIDGKYVPQGNAKLKIGMPVTITVAVPHPSDVQISDVYLYISTNGPYTDGTNGPTGQVAVLGSHRGTFSSTDTITAAWTPSALFGKTKLYINVDATMTDAVSNARIGDPVTSLDLVA
jgi:hypothetical protein